MEKDPVAREPAFRALLDFGQGTSVSYLFKKQKKIISQVHAIGCQWFSSAPLHNYFLLQADSFIKNLLCL